MANVFRTYLIPAHLGAKAVAICDALGFPEKNMFRVQVNTNGLPIAYAASGIVDSASPILGTAAALFTALKGAPGITLADCEAFKASLDLTPDEPHGRIEVIRAEVAQTALGPLWVSGKYKKDDVVTHNAVVWRNLAPETTQAPQPGVWRKHWGKLL